MNKGTVIHKKVEAALDEYVRPLLATHGGDMEVLRIEDGIVYFRMKGVCAGCSAADLTSEDLINKELVEHVPEITKAVLENRISQDLIDTAKAFLRRRPSGEG